MLFGYKNATILLLRNRTIGDERPDVCVFVSHYIEILLWLRL